MLRLGCRMHLFKRPQRGIDAVEVTANRLGSNRVVLYVGISDKKTIRDFRRIVSLVGSASGLGDIGVPQLHNHRSVGDLVTHRAQRRGLSSFAITSPL